MKAVLVIEMPNEYADRYNVNEMYVWQLTVQDKHGYEMFELVTDKPSHLRPLPEKAAVDESMLGIGFDDFNTIYYLGFNECIDKITGEIE